MLHNQHNNVKNEISRVVHIGLLCTQEIQSLWPTMSKALQMLTKEEQLPAPTNRPFIDKRTIPNKCDDTFYSQKVGISTSIGTISNSSFHPGWPYYYCLRQFHSVPGDHNRSENGWFLKKTRTHKKFFKWMKPHFSG